MSHVAETVVDYRTLTENDLPYDDGEPMESAEHRLQMNLLIETLEVWMQEHAVSGYVGGNMGVYFEQAQVMRPDIYKAPDVFVVLDVETHNERPRKSWIVWQESGKVPDLVIESLSDGTKINDKTKKKTIYQNKLQVADYFWFDPHNPSDFAGFSLKQGVYQQLDGDHQTGIISPRLGLRLLCWEGEYGTSARHTWLRWQTLDGQWLPTCAEREQQNAEKEREKAKREREKKLQAQQQLAELTAKLRAMGLDPNDL